jgi:ABC-type branched-subunit amino acid transport system ATPase component
MTFGQPAGAQPVLEVRDLTCAYGSLQVLFGIDLAVMAGSRVALLGTNGAGKSTLLRTIAGLVAPTSGSVWFDGDDVTTVSADGRTRSGLTLVEGGRAMFPSLSVLENLRLGSYPFLRDRTRVADRLSQVFALFPNLEPRLSQPAGTLSGGEQQMVAFGRALMADPKVLLIDELSLGLAPVVLHDIVVAVDRLARERDITLLVVEQSLNIALTLTTQAYFMEKGEIRFAGDPSELFERGDLVRSVFFGRGRGRGRKEALRS